MIVANIFRLIATLGPIGSLPAPGTCASLLTACCIYFFGMQGLPSYSIIVLCVSLFLALAIELALPTFYSHDPRQVVADEVIGYMIGSLFIPHHLLSHFIFLLTFRFFDITKVLGLRRLEFIRGVQGIVFDDIGAGFYAGILTSVILAIYSSLFC